MVADVDRMDACIETERIDVGEERVKELVAEALALRLVEPEAVDQILFGFVEELDVH